MIMPIIRTGSHNMLIFKASISATLALVVLVLPFSAFYNVVLGEGGWSFY